MDRRADVYAAGVVLWEALTGRRLFDADSDAAIINRVLNARVPAPSTVSNASACLDAVVSRALRFKPDERFSSALEFAQALEQSGVEVALAYAVGEAISAWIGEQDADANANRPLEVRAAAVQLPPAMQPDATQPPQPQDTQAASTNELLRSGLPTGFRRKLLLVAGFVLLALIGLWLRLHLLRASPEKVQVATQPSTGATTITNNPSLPGAETSPLEPSANIAQGTQQLEAKVPRQKTASTNATRVHFETGAHPNVAAAAAPALASTSAAFTPSASASAGKLSSSSPAPSASSAPASLPHSKAKPSEFRPPDL
jgi:eukaryotic-like serine/threonine-protein kinase